MHSMQTKPQNRIDLPHLNGKYCGFTLIWLIVFLAFVLPGCSPKIPEISGTAYYIDCARGSDSNSGTSYLHPWLTLAQVNKTAFQPGDGIFFKRGTTCPGALTPQGAGAEDRPIIMGTYGSGDLPIIDAGKNPEAFRLIGQEYWEIQDIEFSGGTRYGVLVSGEEGTDTLHHIRLKNLMVHDVWGEPYKDKTPGLVVVLANGSLFRDVVIDGVTAYNTNQWAGIEVNGGVGWPIDYANPALAEGVTIRNSTVHNVYGDGIVLWGVHNGLIEYSVAYDTGKQPSPKTVGTPSSIWTWTCIDCVVQYNESYNADSPEIDAGCFDIDWGTRNNTYQYNYGHDCEGYCISVFGAEGVTTENAVVRYNVCSNNGQRSSLASRQGEIFLSTWNGGYLDGVLIYNNTFSWSPPGNYPPLVNKAEFSGERQNLFFNNILVSTKPWLVDGGKTLELDHNLYWLQGEGTPFFFFPDAYYSGFDDYQKLSGQDEHSIFADPLLNERAYHEIGFPKDAFTLQPGSPAIDAGLTLDEMGTKDFFGNPIPYGGSIDIGAHEWSPAINENNPAPNLASIPAVTDSGTWLVGLVDPEDEVSRNQVVFLRSMAEQLALKGLRVILVDISGMSDSQRTNLAASWHLGEIPFVGNLFEISSPATFLIRDGRLLTHWDEMALPFDMAQAIQKIYQ